jgi:adhesin transport system membrane fusion protein
MSRNYHEDELEYLESLSAAVLHKRPSSTRFVLFFWILTIALLIAWAAITNIDEIIRSQGEIIPFGDNQVLQNLEGGIVSEINVEEGDMVKMGDILIKIENSKSLSTFESNELKRFELRSRIARLKAEINMKPLIFDKDLEKRVPFLLIEERLLYNTDMKQFTSQIQILKEQLSQQKQQLKEARQKIKHLERSFELISEEVSMTAPMVTKGVRSKIDYLKLQREANRVEDEMTAVKLSIPRLQSSIKEAKEKIQESKYSLQLKSRKELTEALAESQRIEAQIRGLEDSVNRTVIYSPVDGMIQKLHLHTIGGVVKPGMDMIEVVPIYDNLIVEVKVEPKDIAFVYANQEAKVKFTAYDFAIYGSLEAKVLTISPDTQTDQQDNTYYIVRLKTDKNYLGHKENPLKIIPGMVVNADIITGKRTILDYIIQPMIKSKDYVFSDK